MSKKLNHSQIKDLDYRYYYNQVPGQGEQRNNLIYTSLMSGDDKIFVQWYYNDSEYHKGQNEVVDPSKMEEKWQREIHYITIMRRQFPNLIPNINHIDFEERKLYLEVDGVDFWNQAKCNTANYDSVLPNWQDQMLGILKAHKSLGFYKYSMHPSNFFLVNGQLKSINYFFTYHEDEGPISIADHSSHIHSTRQVIMRKQIESMGLSWNLPESLKTLQMLCFESFRTNYPADFIEKAKEIYND